MPDSGLGFNKLAEQVNNERYVKNTRLWSAVNPAQGGRLGQKNMSQKAFQTQGKFFGPRMSSRPSLDKVISYDTTSLLADIPEKAQKENKNQNNVPDLKLGKRSRPQTTKQHQYAHKTINEEFNERLIYYGTSKGVPTSELP